MAFSVFPRHHKHGPSSWARSVVLQKPTVEVMEEAPWLRSTVAAELKPSLSCSDLTQLRKSSLRSTESAPSSPVLKSVKFHATQLEQVRLFLKSQTPMELHQPCEPEMQLKYINWPPRETTFCSKTIRIDKKFTFYRGEGGARPTLTGRVQVRNLAFHKSVSMRYTMDCWHTLHDTDGKFLKTSGLNSSAFDTFAFEMPLTLTDRGSVRASIDFAVRYCVDGQEFWDNNDGQNYKIQIVATALGGDDEPDDDVEERDLCDSIDEAIEIPIVRKQARQLGTRYSFGQSLSRAKKNTPPATDPSPSQPTTNSLFVAPLAMTLPPPALPLSPPSFSSQPSVPSSYSSVPIAASTPSKSGASTPTGEGSLASASPPCHLSYIPAGVTESLDLDSASYIDLVNKYCFYGSRSPSPMPING